MASFYGKSNEGGGGSSGGVTQQEVERIAARHAIVSVQQPTAQKKGDYWFVVIDSNQYRTIESGNFVRVTEDNKERILEE